MHIQEAQPQTPNTTLAFKTKKLMVSLLPTRSEILDSLKRTTPDLVLLDVHLPGMDGFDLLRDIRQDRAIAKTLILMSSGLSLEPESLRAGADGFIAKPYMPDELITKLRQMLGTFSHGEET